MKFRERIANAIKGFVANPSQFFFGLTSLASNLRRRSVETDPVGNYAGWVYAAASKRAKRVGAIELELYQLARDGALNELEDHEILSLLHRANPAQSKYQFFFTLELFIIIWGSAPVYKDRAGTNKILNLWPLRPDLLRAITDSKGNVVKYDYTIGGMVQTLPAEDVILINEPNPKDLRQGYSALNAAALEVDADMAAAIWNKMLVENWAEPGGILTTEQKLSDAEFTRLEKTWNARKGSGDAARAAVLEKGLKYEAIGRSPKEMDLVEQRGAHRNAIVAILGVPMSIMTSEDVNLANAEVGERVFARDTIDPEMNLIISTLNEFLVPEYGDDLMLSYESPIPQDQTQDLALATGGTSGFFLTTNEKRELFNYAPLEGGDSIFVPLGYVPQIGDGKVDPYGSTDPAKSALPQGIKFVEMKVKKESHLSPKLKSIKRRIMARQHLRKAITGRIADGVRARIADAVKGAEEGKKLTIKIVGAREEARDGSVKAEVKEGENMDPRLKAERIDYLAKLTIAIAKGKAQYGAYFKTQEKEVLANLKEVGLPKAYRGKLSKKSIGNWVNQILFDAHDANNKIVELSSALYRDNITIGAAAVASLLGIDPSNILATPHVVDFIKDRSFLQLGVNDTTRDALRASLTEGVQKGEGLGEIRDRITGIYTDATGFRAETIARTEVGASQNFGRTAEMTNQKVEKKVWICIFSNSRDAHMDADGQVVDVRDSFSVGGESLDYPGDPAGSPENTINCQCSVSPTLG